MSATARVAPGEKGHEADERIFYGEFVRSNSQMEHNRIGSTQNTSTVMLTSIIFTTLPFTLTPDLCIGSSASPSPSAQRIGPLTLSSALGYAE